MSSTSQFQKIPDSFNTPEEAAKSKEQRYPTNPRYPSFMQRHFTAGDKQQFEEYRDARNGNNPIKNIDLSNNLFNTDEITEKIQLDIYWKKYRNLNTQSVDNTFNYLFFKFKKGVFVSIKNNKLEVFLPFNNHTFINEWSERIKQDPTKYRTVVDFLIYTSALKGYKIQPKDICENISKWYANNCLLRYEEPPAESDSDMCNFKDMLETLCSQRIVPDIEFFLNKRDFPLLKKNDTEPYEQIYDSDRFPLLSHKYQQYCPVLSMVKTSLNSDIVIPTWEDYARVMSNENPPKYFEGCRQYKCDFSTSWDKKISTCIFRGSSTGCGTTIETNPRLKAAYLSTKSPIENGYRLLDAGIVKWQTRPRKQSGNPYLQTIEPLKMPFDLVKPLTPEEQSKYKYILNIDGNVSAFRLSLELSMGSVILLVDSVYSMWFKKFLVEYQHYVPVASDLSNLFDQIRWCREHDFECQQIAQNAKDFYNKYLSKDGLLDYLQIVLTKIKRMTGYYFYNTKKVEDVIEIKQKSLLSLEYPLKKNFVKIKPNLSFMVGKRDYYIMEGLREFINNNAITQINFNKVHESKDSLIEICNIESKDVNNIKFLLKKSTKVKETVNETFIGINCINQLLKDIPNFRYTYYYNSDNNTSMYEYMEGVTLKQYIINGCSLKELNNIFMILCLSLAMAQERYGFVHYDLYPWNIIITKIKKRKITYQFEHYVFVVETETLPIIIDYGKSSAIYKGQHYGTIKPFETKLFQDGFSLIISSLYEVVNVPKEIDQNKLAYIMKMVNFFTGNDFHKQPVKDYNSLMSFLTTNKKYNEMIYTDKCGLNKHTPIELFLYLSELKLPVFKGERLSVPSTITQIKYPNKTEYTGSIGVSSFYYDIIADIDFSKDIQKYLEQVVDYIRPNNLSGLYSAKDMISYINACNTIHITMEKLKEISNNPLIQKIIDDIKKNFNNYKPIRKDIHIKYFNIKKEFMEANYTPETFSVQDKILTILQDGQKVISTDILIFREMFVFNLLYLMPYNLPNELDFARMYGKYLLYSSLALLNHNANINTVKSISKSLYPEDIEEFEKFSIQPEKVLRTLKDILVLIRH